eukprot:15475464-Alexandrium_andersonii.AAC.1
MSWAMCASVWATPRRTSGRKPSSALWPTASCLRATRRSSQAGSVLRSSCPGQRLAALRRAQK